MAEFNFNPGLLLVTARCDVCGRYEAHEEGAQYRWRCGRCAQNTIDSLHAKVENLRRTVSALRGALTRSKRRGA